MALVEDIKNGGKIGPSIALVTEEEKAWITTLHITGKSEDYPWLSNTNIDGRGLTGVALLISLLQVEQAMLSWDRVPSRYHGLLQLRKGTRSSIALL